MQGYCGWAGLPRRRSRWQQLQSQLRSFTAKPSHPQHPPRPLSPARACPPLQLPQGALCYWATSSTLALAQNYALRQPGVRQLAGLPVAASEAPAGSSPAAAPAPAAATADAAAAAAAAIATGAAGPLPAGVNPELRQFLLTTSDQAALFERAAALRSEGRAGATSTVLQRILQLYPGQPNALYALGQVCWEGPAVGRKGRGAGRRQHQHQYQHRHRQ